MTAQMQKPWALAVAFLETMILSVVVVDAIDIIARVIAAVAALVIMIFTVKRLKAETKLAKTKQQREEFELKQREIEYTERLKIIKKDSL